MSVENSSAGAGPPGSAPARGWNYKGLEVLIAFHAVEGRGVRASFFHDDLARICPDLSIFTSLVAELLLLGPGS